MSLFDYRMLTVKKTKSTYGRTNGATTKQCSPKLLSTMLSNVTQAPPNYDIKENDITNK